MAAITVTNALSEMRTLLRDKNSNAPAFTDDQGIILLNMGLLWWSENMERRTYRFTRGAGAIPWLTPNTTTWDTTGRLVDDTNFGATVHVAEILELALDNETGGGVNLTAQLERMDWGELRNRQLAYGATTAQPTHWSALRLANSTQWKVALHPPPNNESTGPDVGWTIVGIVRVQPTVLTAVANTIDLGDSEVRSVILLACILMAPLINKPELGEHFKTLLPERVREKMETTKVHDEATV